MVLMLAIAFLMVAGRFSSLVSDTGRQQQRSPVRRNRMAVLVLGAAAALISLPSAAWANAPVTDGQAQIQNAKTETGVTTTSARSATAQGYAAREATSKNLENFAGGDTTVIIGGSALVIIVVVLLILIII